MIRAGYASLKQNRGADWMAPDRWIPSSPPREVKPPILEELTRRRLSFRTDWFPLSIGYINHIANDVVLFCFSLFLFLSLLSVSLFLSSSFSYSLIFSIQRPLRSGVTLFRVVRYSSHEHHLPAPTR